MQMHQQNTHYAVMFFIMLVAGLLSTMNVWVDKVDDIRISLNDVYMILLMTGWMFLLMGIFDGNMNIMLLGLILVVINLWCIRTQFGISEKQYLTGMIPHHSMAVLMSKRLLEKRSSNTIKPFLDNLITTQDQEITYMKSLLG
jgi:hypothetical protein